MASVNWEIQRKNSFAISEEKSFDSILLRRRFIPKTDSGKFIRLQVARERISIFGEIQMKMFSRIVNTETYYRILFIYLFILLRLWEGADSHRHERIEGKYYLQHFSLFSGLTESSVTDLETKLMRCIVRSSVRNTQPHWWTFPSLPAAAVARKLNRCSSFFQPLFCLLRECHLWHVFYLRWQLLYLFPFVFSWHEWLE